MEKVELELTCMNDGVSLASERGTNAKWTKFSLVNKTKKVDELETNEFADISGRIMGDSEIIKPGKKYKVTIEEIEEIVT